MKKLFVVYAIFGYALIIACAFAKSAIAEPLIDLSDGQVGRIEFSSSNPPNRWAMIRGNLGESQTVFGDLLLPKTTNTERVPAVVFSHGSEGVSSVYFDVWARALNGAGIAVFVVDSFKPRGFDDILGPTKQLTYDAQSSNISDALHALRLLSTHPRIDPNRIFHMGWSRGGNTVLAAAWPAYQSMLPAGMRWAGSIAVYPGCNIRYNSETPSLPAPLLLLLAEKDNMTPALPCVDYAKRLAAKNFPVTYKVYVDAYHVFDRLNQKYSQSNQGTFRDCNMDVNLPNSKTQTSWTPGFDAAANKPINNAEEFKAFLKACERSANTISESNTKAREQAVMDVLTFIGAAKI